MERSYYAIIPANVRYDDRLTPNAKLLYGEITALCNEKGYCWASNSYFAELYKVSKETVSRWISKLEELGYIRTELIYEQGTKSVKERRIYICDAPIDKNINRYRQNNQYPIDKNVNTPIDKNVKGNNTVFNNTINSSSSNNNSIDKNIKENNTVFNNTINSSSNSATATAGNEFSKIVQAFEQNGFGLINLYTKEILVDLVETYSSSWVLDAIEEAVKSNVRKLKYVEAILQRWKAEGKGTEKPKPKKEEPSNWRRSDRRL